MVDKASLSVAIVAILIAAGSLAFTASSLGGIGGQLEGLRGELQRQLDEQIADVKGRIDRLGADLGPIKQEQSAIRSLVEERIGGLERALEEARRRLAEAEKAAEEARKEAEALAAEKRLEEAAKQEQPPLIYGVIDAPDFANIVWPRFRESFPWAPSEGRYIEGFAALRSRFVSEYQAGAPTADILWQSQAPFIGELATFLAPFPEMKWIGLYPDAMIFPNREEPLGFVTHLLPGVMIYNTNLVSEEDVPKSWFDLADPKWKGKLVMQDPRRLETTTKMLADLWLAMGDEKWEEFVRGLAANDPTFTGSNTEAYTKVVAGEFPVGIALINDVLAQKPGTPVAIAWPTEEPKGVPAAANTMIGIQNKAANPNFAKLFIQWLMSPAGQRALADTKRPPALITLEHPVSLGKVIPPGIKIFESETTFFTDPKAWEARVKAFFD